ncbi:amino acid ABC transporter permease [Rhizobium leguminosarum]|uniref:amino acid ABC transporter permease n=1 Tax=Rhizobium leguminosarum TaxID=384 RepID=UPI00143F55AA|nr:amino acid ABC transporter permease [Rhizobium leguminosarum]NKL21262.1 ABC transporter permease subunit [Rhizobium leguminosarum bv. viciae]NKL56769.1 ABC transporter permease subunit [Rhizobium leguminosarum bv. viciae]
MIDGIILFFVVYKEYLPSWWPELMAGVVATLQITIGAFAVALVFGVLAAIARVSRNVVLKAIAVSYIELARSIPGLVVLFLIYFGLVPLGIAMEAITAAIIGLGVTAGGYLAEIFRAGIEATHRGQREAGMAVGMTPAKIYRYVILPQAFRIVLPPLVNMLINVLKESSLASLISAPEIMLQAKDISSTDFLPLHVLILAGAIYLAMALPMSFIASRLEARMKRGLSTSRL